MTGAGFELVRHAMELAVALFFTTLLCWELGRRIGRRRTAADPEGWQAGTGVIDGAAFGLLGLILGFTFAGAAGPAVACCGVSGASLVSPRTVQAHRTAIHRMRMRNSPEPGYARLYGVMGRKAAPVPTPAP